MKHSKYYRRASYFYYVSKEGPLCYKAEYVPNFLSSMYQNGFLPHGKYSKIICEIT